LYGAETWTLQKVDQKYLESFEMWCWRRKEIIWTKLVGNEEVLCRFKEKINKEGRLIVLITSSKGTVF
jgi:hypothetical protein